MNIQALTEALPSSLLIRGDERIAYRDPAVILRDGVFHIYMTVVETEADGSVYMYVGHTATSDLRSFTPVRKLTVRDRRYNFSSPGNIVFHDGRYKMCLQTYCRENGEKYGNDRCRVYLMESDDLVEWGEPYLMAVKGDIPIEDMGRMIDPYLIFNEADGLWNCFYKQNGISRSLSPDLRRFTYAGYMDGGENVSILQTAEGYYMFHSPDNGIGVKFSTDLTHWEDRGEPLVFGQAEWIWARGRLTAGTVVEVAEGESPLYLMFFHGTGPQDESVCFDTNAGIGLAWSRDLVHWNWK